MKCAVTLGELLSVFVTLTGIYFAYKSLKLQLDIQNNQQKIQVFSEYTKRYQDIIADFPENINEQGFDFNSLVPTEYQSTMRKMRQYFDLCFEEWYLNSKGLLDTNFWDLWSGGMTTALSKPAFVNAWGKIKATSVYGKEFEKFIDEKANSVN